MYTKERILTILLAERIKAHPQYAKALGIQIQADRLQPHCRKMEDTPLTLPRHSGAQQM